MVDDLVIFAMGIALIFLGIGMWDADKKIRKLERRTVELNKKISELKRRVNGELPQSGGYEDGSEDYELYND